MIEKEFDIKERLNLPINLVLKKFNKYYVIIAPDKPNWLVVNVNEYKLFVLLRTYTMLESLIRFKEQMDNSEEECIAILQSLLSKIDAIDFYEDVYSLDEEPIEDIVKTIHITTTNDCNLRCKHCYMSAGIKYQNYLDLSLVAQKIKEISDYYSSDLDIVVSGGEPLLHPEIVPFLRSIKKHHVVLFSNGLLINDNNIAVIAETCDSVQLSMEGISKDVFEKIRGNDSYDRFFRSISLLIEYNIRLVLAITVLPNTIEDIKKNLVSFIKSLNYKNIEIRLNHEVEMSGNAINNFANMHHDDTIEDNMLSLVKDLIDIGINYESKSERNVIFTNCGIGGSIVFEADGKIYPCSKYSDFYRCLDEDIVDTIKYFDSLNNETACTYMLRCQYCELKNICAGGCKIENYIKTGDLLIPSCDEVFKTNQYKRLVKDYLRDD